MRTKEAEDDALDAAVQAWLESASDYTMLRASIKTAIDAYNAAIASVQEPTTIELRTMYLSGPRPDGSFADYFVLVKCGNREVTPYCFRERFKAEYEIATLRWVLLGAPEPDPMSFNEESYPNFPSPPKAGE